MYVQLETSAGLRHRFKCKVDELEEEHVKVKAGSVGLHVEERGAGSPALVFLHYWGGSLRTWSEVIDRLDGDYRCVAYDHRGWGESDRPASGYGIADLAGDARALITALDLTDYVLVGHSMGGKVAQSVAAERPAGLRGLVLVAPAPPVPQDIPAEAREQQIHAYDTRENVLQAVTFLTVQRPSGASLEQIVEDSLRGSAEAKRAWPAEAAYEDISAHVPDIAVPTLILAGDRDPQDPLEQQKREVLARIPGATLSVVSDCGHLSPIEQPGQIASAIRAFVAGLGD